jgi:hypothetical protein
LNNRLGFPKGGVGVTLADQGISNGPLGIKQGFSDQAGVEALYFNSFTIGANPFSLEQINNTYQGSDNFTKVLGNHTIKMGGQLIWYQVKQLPNLVANGTFSFFGSGNQTTGNGFADFCSACLTSTHSNPARRFMKLRGRADSTCKTVGAYAQI